MIAGRSRRGIIVLLCANTLFWLWFWVDFSRSLVPYQSHPPGFEEALPEYIWYGHAVPYHHDVSSVPYRLMKWVQQPVYAIVESASWKLVKVTGFQYKWGDETFLGVSVGGYQVIATMLLSFVQWFSIAKIVGSVIPRLSKGRHEPAVGDSTNGNESLRA